MIFQLDCDFNLMQCMLRKVTTWCTETGLRVKPDTIELVVFTRKHKVLTFAPPGPLLRGKS